MLRTPTKSNTAEMSADEDSAKEGAVGGKPLVDDKTAEDLLDLGNENEETKRDQRSALRALMLSMLTALGQATLPEDTDETPSLELKVMDYDVQKQAQLSQSKSIKDLEEGELGQYKRDIIMSVFSGLLLFIARIDFRFIFRSPTTLRSGAAHLLLSALPQLIPGDDRGKIGLDQDGLTFETVSMSVRQWPLYLLARVHHGIVRRLESLMNTAKPILMDTNQMLEVATEFKQVFSDQADLIDTFTQLWVYLEDKANISVGQSDAQVKAEGLYLDMIRALARRVMPTQGARIIDALTELRTEMKKRNATSDEIDPLDKAVRRYNEVVDLSKLPPMTIPPPTMSIPPPNIPSSLGLSKKFQEGLDRVDQDFMRELDRINPRKGSLKDGNLLPPSIRPKLPTGLSDLSFLDRSAAPPTTAGILHSTKAAGAPSMHAPGVTTMTGDVTRRPDGGEDTEEEEPPKEKTKPKALTVDDLLASYEYKPPQGGFGYHTAELDAEQRNIKTGYWGHDFQTEVTTTYQAGTNNGPGAFSKTAAHSITQMTEAAAIAGQDMTGLTPQQAILQIKAVQDRLVSAFSPQAVKMLASGQGLDSKELGFGITAQYSTLDPPRPGTGEFKNSARKDVLAIIGEPWRGIGRPTDNVNALEFFAAVHGVIDGRLKPDAAITLLKTCTQGSIRNTIVDFPQGTGFAHVWRSLCSWYHQKNDFLALEQTRLNLKSKKPTNIAHTIRRLLSVNKLCVLAFPESTRKVSLINNMRSDLEYLVRTWFPTDIEPIMLPEARARQSWSDERQSCRLQGKNPDEIATSYHPIFTLAELIVGRLEMVYGNAVMQKTQDAPRKAEPARGRARGFHVDEVAQESNLHDAGVAAFGDEVQEPANHNPGGSHHDDHDNGPHTGAEESTDVTAFGTNPGNPATKAAPKAKRTLPVYVICPLCLTIGHIYSACTTYVNEKPGTRRCESCRGFHVSKCRSPGMQGHKGPQ